MSSVQTKVIPQKSSISSPTTTIGPQQQKKMVKFKSIEDFKYQQRLTNKPTSRTSSIINTTNSSNQSSYRNYDKSFNTSMKSLDRADTSGSTTIFFPKQRRTTSMNLYRNSVISSTSSNKRLSTISSLSNDNDNEDEDMNIVMKKYSNNSLHTRNPSIGSNSTNSGGKLSGASKNNSHHPNNKRMSLISVVSSPADDGFSIHNNSVGNISANESNSKYKSDSMLSPQMNLSFGSRRFSGISQNSSNIIQANQQQPYPPISAGSGSSTSTKVSGQSTSTADNRRRALQYQLQQYRRDSVISVGHNNNSSSTILGSGPKSVRDSNVPKPSLKVTTNLQTPNVANSDITSTTTTEGSNDRTKIIKKSSRTAAKLRYSNKKSAKTEAMSTSQKYDRITQSLTEMFDHIQTDNQNKAQLIQKLEKLKDQNALNKEKLDSLLSKIKQVENNFEIYDSKVDNDCTLIMICMCLIKNI